MLILKLLAAPFALFLLMCAYPFWREGKESLEEFIVRMARMEWDERT